MSPAPVTYTVAIAGMGKRGTHHAEAFAADPIAFVEAYGDVVAKKIQKIQTIYLTRVGAKQAMRDLVFSEVVKTLN